MHRRDRDSYREASIVPFPIRKGIVANVHIETVMRKQPVKLTLCFVVFPASLVEKIMEPL